MIAELIDEQHLKVTVSMTPSTTVDDHVQFLKDAGMEFRKDSLSVPKYESEFLLFLSEPVNPFEMKSMVGKATETGERFVGVVLTRKPCKRPVTDLLQ